MKSSITLVILLSGFAFTKCSEENQNFIPPQPPITTDSSNTTATSHTSTTVTPTTTTPNVTTPTTTATTTAIPTTTNHTTTTTATTPTTSAATTTTTPSTIHTTVRPSPTAKPTSEPLPDRRFDAPSFIGGFVLALGLVAIAFVSWKFYMSRQENYYHTL